MDNQVRDLHWLFETTKGTGLEFRDLRPRKRVKFVTKTEEAVYGLGDISYRQRRARGNYREWLKETGGEYDFYEDGGLNPADYYFN